MMNLMKTYYIRFVIAEANEHLDKNSNYFQTIRGHILQRRKSTQLNPQNTPSGVYFVKV